jgi:hypothetical protein
MQIKSLCLAAGKKLLPDHPFKRNRSSLYLEEAVKV